MTSIVIDTCVLRLYDSPADPIYKDLFYWIKSEGKLCISKKLVQEYVATGNRNITLLLTELSKNSDNMRLKWVENSEIKSFKEDKTYRYTCNIEDINHARLVFLSERKKMISQDKKLIDDINGFKKISGIKPEAAKHPTKDFYI